jgi:fructokinase
MLPRPLCIFGEVLFDCFPDGREVLGGAPFNVAWHLQAFGQSPLFVSRVGEDAAAERIRSAMSDWGMGLGGLQSDPGHPTGRVEVRLAGGEPSYDIVDGSAYDFIAREALPDVRPGLVYHGTLALRHPVSAAALEALKARSPGLIFVDVNLRDPWWRREAVLSLLDAAHWVKLNRDELALLGDGGADELGAARRFRETHGLHGLVLTLGAEGAFALAEGDEPVRVTPVPASRVVDAVGAGDAFAAVLILGLRLGWPMTSTLDRAQVFASELVQRRGATVSDPALYAGLAAGWGL